MAKNLTVILENRPGALASLGFTLGEADVNIEGICGFPMTDQEITHLIVDKPEAAVKALEANGFLVREREVLVVDIEKRPGAGAVVWKKIADAGVNIDLFYKTTGGALVLGVSDLDAARQALAS